MSKRKYIWRPIDYDAKYGKPSLNTSDQLLLKTKELIESHAWHLATSRELGLITGIPDYQRLFIATIAKNHIPHIRRTGQSTRVVNIMIDFFFTFGIMKAEWLIGEGKDMHIRQHTFDIFRRRLRSEHEQSLHGQLDINRKGHIQMKDMPYEGRRPF